MAAQLAAAVQLAGCGMGWIDNPSGGDDHLPTRGAGPYAKLAVDRDTLAEEPYVVSGFRIHLEDPAPLRRADGGFRLWFGHSDAARSRTEIWYAELARLDEPPEVEPVVALAPDREWEQSRISAPCVVELSSEHLVMFYQGGPDDTPAIGRADSRDGGGTWTKHGANPLLASFAEPSVAQLPNDRWLLLATRPGEPGIFRAMSADGVAWQAEDRPVLEPRVELATAYDRFAISDPWLTVRETVTGDSHYSLFFSGIDRPGEDGTTSVGWAGSFDGRTWHRFANPDDAVLEPGGVSEHGPAVLLEPDAGILFFSQKRQGTQSIAVAVHP